MNISLYKIIFILNGLIHFMRRKMPQYFDVQIFATTVFNPLSKQLELILI